MKGGIWVANRQTDVFDGKTEEKLRQEEMGQDQECNIRRKENGVVKN